MYKLRRDLDSLRSWVADLDRDVADNRAERRAQRNLLNALGETQSEHGRTLHEIAGQVGLLTVGQAELKAGHAQLVAKVGGLETKVEGLDSKVEGLDSKVDGLDSKVDAIAAAVDEVLRRLPERSTPLTPADVRVPPA